jgi:hypothetical protein
VSTVRKSYIALAVIGVIIVVAYFPGLSGPFVFDDTYHIVSNPAVALKDLDIASLKRAALSNDSGPLKRPLALISLAFNHYFAGGLTNTFPFKVTNLAIHILNIGLVYWLSLLLLRQLSIRAGFHQPRLHPWLPALVAATWALHPLQLTSILYVVQRMTTLSALFVFAGIIIFVYGRLRLQENRTFGYTLMAVGLVGGLALGLASKENAALLPLYILVIEVIFFRHQELSGDCRQKLKWFYAITVLLPYLLALLWLVSQPYIVLNAYAWREFSLWERLLTESRVVWFYISLLLVPIPDRLSLHHDDMPISIGLFEPGITAVAVAGIVLASIIAIVTVKKYPALSFSVLWFLAGHAMESTFIGLEIAHEHRNYLPSFGPIFGIVYGLSRTPAQLRASIRMGAYLLVLLALGSATYMRATIWANQDALTMHLLKHHPESPRTHLMAAELYALNDDAVGAIDHYARAAALAPNEAAYLIRLVKTVASTIITQPSASLNNNRIKPAPKLRQLPAFVSLKRSGPVARFELSQPILHDITKKLGDAPIHARTVQVLGELSECVVASRDVCGYMYSTLVEWYKTAIHNPRTVDGHRNDLTIGLVRVYLEYGDYVDALEVAKHTRALDPSNPNIILMEADIYFRLGQPKKSKELLSLLDTPSVAPTDNVKKQADVLSALIKSKLKQGADRVD